MKPYFRFYFFRFEISIQKMWGRNQLLENYEKSIFDEINFQKKKNFKVFKLNSSNYELLVLIWFIGALFSLLILEIWNFSSIKM